MMDLYKYFIYSNIIKIYYVSIYEFRLNLVFNKLFNIQYFDMKQGLCYMILINYMLL